MKEREDVKVPRSFFEYFAISKFILLSTLSLISSFLSLVFLFSLPPIYPMFHVISDKFEIE